MSWYGSQDDDGFLGRAALMVAYIGAQILLLLLFIAYRYDGSVFVGGGVLVFVVYFVFLSLLPWILNEDLFNRVDAPVPRELTGLQTLFLGLVVAINGFMTVVAVSDVSNHPWKSPLLG